MKALTDAQKNASLLEEYHELYELQRSRLEKMIFVLTDERDKWIRATYSVALKVILRLKNSIFLIWFITILFLFY